MTNVCDGYIVGQMPRFPAEFRAGSVLADPTVVKFIYQKPGSAAVVLTYGVDGALVRESTGKYYVDWEIDEYIAGYWTWRWESTGVVTAAHQGRFRVIAERPVG